MGATDGVAIPADDAAALDEAYPIAKRGRGTYTVERVPPAYLTRR
jgi:hypothetical protein